MIRYWLTPCTVAFVSHSIVCQALVGFKPYLPSIYCIVNESEVRRGYQGVAWQIVVNRNNDRNFKTTLTNVNKTTATDHLQLMIWVDTPANKSLLPGSVIGREGCRFRRVSLTTRTRPPTDKRAYLKPVTIKLEYLSQRKIGKCTTLGRCWCIGQQ